MSKLSPAAQAVHDAFWSGHHYPDSLSNEDVAAALRAAADQGEIFFDAYDSPVRVVTVDDLLAIADELEGH